MGDYPQDEGPEQGLPYSQRPPFTVPHHYYDSNIQTMTNPQFEIRELEMTLKNGYEDEEGKFVPFGKPLMNEAGIKAVIGLTKSIVNRNTHMSSFEKPQIYELIMFNGDALIKLLMMNRKTFEIENSNMRNIIHAAAINTWFESFNRALDGGERRFWRGSQSDIRTTVVNEAKKQGILARFNPFGGTK